MAATILGPVSWSLSRDKDGHRDYEIVWKIRGDDVEDGPGTVFLSAGLPAVGSSWNFGGDYDAPARCLPNFEMVQFDQQGDEPTDLWLCTQHFSTRPLKRCESEQFENPLLEPFDISGSFIDHVTEATHDKDGAPLLMSSKEMMRGKAVEVTSSLPTVKISFNTLSLDLGMISTAKNRVNDSSLWGLGPREIKLAQASWSRMFYGTCTYYFNISYEFEIKADKFNQFILDEGTKVLCEGGSPNNPKHYIQYKDVNGENAKVLLDGTGKVLEDADNPFIWEKKILREYNMLLLGIPAVLFA